MRALQLPASCRIRVQAEEMTRMRVLDRQRLVKDVSPHVVVELGSGRGQSLRMTRDVQPPSRCGPTRWKGLNCIEAF
jgi:hypothetical protein